MNDSKKSLVNRDVTQEDWDQLIENLASGRISVLDVMNSPMNVSIEKRDYRAFVDQTRAWIVIFEDKRTTKRLLDEIQKYIAATDNAGKSYPDFEQSIEQKGGNRVFKKLTDFQAELHANGPRLLSGQTFEECLEQYQKIMKHMEQLWNASCNLYRSAEYPLCTFTSILMLEELGKLGRLWIDLLGYDRKNKNAPTGPGALGRNHRIKAYMGVISGALVNSRLDRVLGLEKIKQLLLDVEKGALETLRQSCLYIDMIDHNVVTPSQQIDQETGKFFTVLAGELWAEILGHFPWEFESMLKKVIDFEIEIGFPPAQVKER